MESARASPLTAPGTLDAVSPPDLEISVILVVSPNRGRESVIGTLQSLQRQRGRVPHEIIVVDDPREPTVAMISQQFPEVVLLESCADSVATKRNVAVERARGRILYFCDDHVFFSADHLEIVRRQFNDEQTIVGGPVANANPKRLASWAHYYCEYYKWLPIKKELAFEDLPGSNFAVSRQVLREIGLFPQSGRYGQESQLFVRLRREGHTLHYCPEMKIRHLHVERIRDFWSLSFDYGRGFAANRGFGPGKRLLHAVTTPAVGFVLYWRMYRQARSNPAYLRKLLLCTPQLCSTIAIRMLGELVGYLRPRHT